MLVNKQKILALSLLFLSSFQLFFSSINPSSAAGPEPDAINDLSVVDGNGEVTLAWTAPNDNGSAITNYRVEYGLAGVNFSQTCYDMSCNNVATGATVPGLSNFSEYQFRVIAINNAGESVPSNIATGMPTSCSPLANNNETPTTVESGSCIRLTVTAGTLSFSHIPGSFNFPAKASLQTAQPSFSNDNTATSHVDVSTAVDDIVTVTDLRNFGGFDVTITSSHMTNGHTNLPLNNLYIATSYPENNDLTPLDPLLIGTQTNGVEFADGSNSTGNIASPVHSTAVTGSATNSTQLNSLISAYTTDGANFDSNMDGNPDTIVLMQSTGGRLARMSQATNFYLNIPADQEPGTYAVLFTLDLIPN